MSEPANTETAETAPPRPDGPSLRPSEAEDPVGFDEVLAATKALADPSRQRIMHVVRRHELTVSDLCDVLDQSQPRVSRHLKVLADAGLVERHAQGSHAYYRMADTKAAGVFGRALEELLDPEDPILLRDTFRLADVREARANRASEYFSRVASQWEHLRELHVADELVEQAILGELPTRAGLRMLDLGTGTGRMLELVADDVVHGLGIDQSPEMLDLARSRLDAQGHRHLRVRHGSVYDLDITPHSFDVAMLHHVLHFLEQPDLALRHAAATLRSDGVLLVVDFAPHQIVELRDQHHHRHLGIAPEELTRWAEGAGLRVERLVQFDPEPTGATASGLPVCLWRLVPVASSATGNSNLEGSP